MHNLLTEYQIVVKGTSRVTLDGGEKILTEKKSIYLPVCAVHALENREKIPLELIGVQLGAYLSEDYIIRFKDLYGRVGKN